MWEPTCPPNFLPSGTLKCIADLHALVLPLVESQEVRPAKRMRTGLSVEESEAREAFQLMKEKKRSLNGFIDHILVMEPVDFLTIGKPYRNIRLRTYFVWMTISIIANLCNARTVTAIFIRSYLSMIVWLMLIFNHDRDKAQRCLLFLTYMRLNPWERVIENLMYTAITVKLGLLYLLAVKGT